MEFIKDYMDNTVYRHMLNDTTGMIFGFSFEDWYTSGFYAGEYIPYSYVENGEIIANASANIMKMIVCGSEKLLIQIGTVMTRPEYRNLGLAKTLIKKIINDYQNIADGFYLFANLDALDFYKKVGFLQQNQWRYSANINSENIVKTQKFQPAGKELLGAYRAALNNAHIGSAMDQINRTSLQLFYTGNMEDVYYNPTINCFAVMHTEEDVLYLDSVISNQKLPLEDVLRCIPMTFKKVILGFTPDDEQLFVPEIYDGEDDYRFFYIGETLEAINDKKLYLPLMSHA